MFRLLLRRYLSFGISFVQTNFSRLNFLQTLEIRNVVLSEDDLCEIFEGAGSTLRRLVLTGNTSVTEFSFDLATYGKIRVLELSRSRFLGSIVFNSVFPSLRHADFSRTAVSSVSSLLPSLPNLRSLSLQNCQNIHTGLTLPPSLQLSKLTRLNLANTKIYAGQVESLLCHMPRLLELNLSFCDVVRRLVIQHPTLRDVDLTSCRLLRSLRFLGCPSLRCVILKKNPLSGEVIRQILIDCCTSLVEVDISECYHIEREQLIIPEGIIFQVLERINAQYTMIDDASVHSILAASTCLDDFKLRQTDFMANQDIVLWPERTFRSNSLRSVDLSLTNITDEGVSWLMHSLPNLKTLLLTGCIALTPALELRSDTVEVMVLRGLVIGDATVEYAVEHCPALCGLVLSRCDQLNRPSFTNHSNLQRLDLSDSTCTHVTISDCPALQAIDFTHCQQLSSWNFGPLPALTEINVARCFVALSESLLSSHPNLTVRGVEASVEATMTFQEVNFMQCLLHEKTGVWVKPSEFLAGFTGYDVSGSESDVEEDQEEDVDDEVNANEEGEEGLASVVED